LNSAKSVSSALERSLLAVILAVAIGTVQGAQWIVEGRVVGVSDGDTITVLDDAKTHHKVRIAGIDAPEKAQAFGEQSRQSLAEKTLGVNVTRWTDSGARSARCGSSPWTARAAADVSPIAIKEPGMIGIKEPVRRGRNGHPGAVKNAALCRRSQPSL
jgi:endonuclease YncB( thermonuclease family)